MRNIDPHLIIKLTDTEPVKYIGANILAEIITKPKQVMFLVKALGDQVINPAETIGRLFRALDLGTVANYLAEGGHSTELQDWWDANGIVFPVPEHEAVITADEAAVIEDEEGDADTLLDLVNTSLVKLPTTITELADGVFVDVLSKQPSGQANYVMDYLMQVSKFGQIGTVKTGLEYQADTKAAIVLDCSGNMGRKLGEAIAESVVKLADTLKCDLILVSSTAVRLPAGTFGVKTVLANWQNQLTLYNQLIPHFRDISQSYDVVITIADYDSISSHKSQIMQECNARIQQVYDVCVEHTLDSNGNLRTSFLAECLGQLADNVIPVFVGAPDLNYWD